MLPNQIRITNFNSKESNGYISPLLFPTQNFQFSLAFPSKFTINNTIKFALNLWPKIKQRRSIKSPKKKQTKGIIVTLKCKIFYQSGKQFGKRWCCENHTGRVANNSWQQQTDQSMHPNIFF